MRTVVPMALLDNVFLTSSSSKKDVDKGTWCEGSRGVLADGYGF